MDNQFIGPYIAKITSVNVNYGVYSLTLDSNPDLSVTLTGSNVYLTKFFAMRKVKQMEKLVATNLAIAEAEAEATEL